MASNEHLLAVTKHPDQFVPVSGTGLHQCFHLSHSFFVLSRVRLTVEYLLGAPVTFLWRKWTKFCHNVNWCF